MKTRSRVGNAAGIILSTAILLFIITGCVGYVDPGGGGAVLVGPPVPDVVVFGGGYDRGHDVHGWSHRGFESRQRR